MSGRRAMLNSVTINFKSWSQWMISMLTANEHTNRHMHAHTHTVSKCLKKQCTPRKASQLYKVDTTHKHTSTHVFFFQKHKCTGKYCSGRWRYGLIRVCVTHFFSSISFHANVAILKEVDGLQCITQWMPERQFLFPESHVSDRDGRGPPNVVNAVTLVTMRMAYVTSMWRDAKLYVEGRFPQATGFANFIRKYLSKFPWSHL